MNKQQQHVDNNILIVNENGFKNGVIHINREKYFFFIRKCVFSLIILGFCFSVSAQLPIMGWPPRMKKDLIPVQGGKEGKSYAIIIKTEKSKNEIVDITTKFLANYKIVDLEDVKLDEISDMQSEYTIPMTFPNSFAGISAIMGARTVFPPLTLFADLRFEFHENGLMIVFDNFTAKSFFLTDMEKQSFTYHKDKETSDIQEYTGHYAAAAMEGTFLLKALVVMNKGLEGYNDFKSKLDDYFNDVEKKYQLFYKIEKANMGSWLNDEEFLNFADNTSIPRGEQTILNTVLKPYFDEGRLLTVPLQRWTGRVTPVMDKIFKLVAYDLNGAIEGVAEDGEQTYINIDGHVLPVDPRWSNKTPPTNQRDRDNYIRRNEKNAY